MRNKADETFVTVESLLLLILSRQFIPLAYMCSTTSVHSTDESTTQPIFLVTVLQNSNDSLTYFV